jgi:lipoprotein signal peptidase
VAAMAGWLMIFFLIFLDQLSKALVWRYRPQWWFLNQGISFGWFSGSFFWWLGLGLLLILLMIYKKERSPALGLILAGGWANFLDRIIRGGVVDWLRLPFFPWRFNLADFLISLGVICLIASLKKAN